MEEKIVVSYEHIHQLVEKLSEKIEHISAPNPEVVIAIGGGGLLPGRLFRTRLRIPMVAVFLSFYEDDAEVSRKEPQILQWLDEPALNAVLGKHILIVDEVNDSGATLYHCIQEVFRTCRPHSVQVAVLQDKMREKQREMGTDVIYHVGETIEDKWVVYPWSIGGSAQQEPGDSTKTCTLV